jgi:ribulose 1,5-bisphosphate carboxylase large subunit-like protein
MAAGHPERLAHACRTALEALEAARDVRDAAPALHDLAAALAELGVASTTHSGRAICTAQNCAGHRTRA